MAIEFRFLTPEENTKTRAKRTTRKPVKVTGYISSGGKIVLPQKSASQLGFDPETAQFKIAVEQGKRKVKALYLVDTAGDEPGTFTFAKAAKSYTISLAVLLKKNGVDFDTKKFTFTVSPFSYNDNTGYELRFDEPADKPAYSGKRRGPKPKNQVAE